MHIDWASLGQVAVVSIGVRTPAIPSSSSSAPITYEGSRHEHTKPLASSYDRCLHPRKLLTVKLNPYLTL
jgi:hypothetical protein